MIGYAMHAPSERCSLFAERFEWLVCFQTGYCAIELAQNDGRSAAGALCGSSYGPTLSCQRRRKWLLAFDKIFTV